MSMCKLEVRYKMPLLVCAPKLTYYKIECCSIFWQREKLSMPSYKWEKYQQTFKYGKQGEEKSVLIEFAYS